MVETLCISVEKWNILELNMETVRQMVYCSVIIIPNIHKKKVLIFLFLRVFIFEVGI